MSRRPATVGILASLLIATLSAGCATAQRPAVDPSRSILPDATIWDGVFTVAQARRGERVAESQCALCHLVDVEWPLVLERRTGEPVSEIFDFIRTTMPENFPGGLRPREYADILAYMLRLGGASAGTQELPAEQDVLRTIAITPNPARPSSPPER